LKEEKALLRRRSSLLLDCGDLWANQEVLNLYQDDAVHVAIQPAGEAADAEMVRSPC